ncbi:Uncharacterised protein [Mycobacteroides abscessus subsp. abscessus]|nr:Uncharacterised protein [Mycobacteroides abscessus subsp. abscessus]
MTTLSESDSLNILPMCFIACIDGALCGLSETVCSLPTCSSCGTKVFRAKTMASQPMTMGIDRRRIHLAKKVGSAAERPACDPLMRTSQSSRRRRSPRWYTFHLFSRHWP